ncbi:hypothetical protein L596_011450 [Steinernema carpocapsae]|uniref:Uncharacterized protein n=1 Tax=Steinernema carpocapsae TaxID=34508 RepID=A0A4U5NTX0_STECR|nr:hypothetical protein L596_011450 [Steinernema carpocapsae]
MYESSSTTTFTTTTTTEEDIYDANIPELPPEHTNVSKNQFDDKLTDDYSELSYTQKTIKKRFKASGIKVEVPSGKCSDTKLRQIMRMFPSCKRMIDGRSRREMSYFIIIPWFLSFRATLIDASRSRTYF